MELTISLIYGSVRSDRQGIKAAGYLERKLAERGVKVRFIDPLEFNLPLLLKTSSTIFRRNTFLNRQELHHIRPEYSEE